MGIFKRISDIFRANVNDALDKAENPEKMIKLMVVEMQESVTKATASLAQAMAQEKKLEREYNKYLQASGNWKQKATTALTQGNEELAKQALQRKSSADSQAEQYKKMHESAVLTTAKLKEQVEKLKQKLTEARVKETTLIARSQAAKAQKQMAKQIGGFDSNSFAKFDKFEEKILKEEAEAEAYTQMAEEDNLLLEDSFKELEQNAQVDDELAKLKAELNKE